SVAVDRPRDEVYEYLDVLANHEAFCDHFLSDWSASGPAGGVGAKVRVKAKAPGPETWIDIEVVEAVPPVRTVERGTSAGGRRRTRGSYTLTELAGEAWRRAVARYGYGVTEADIAALVGSTYPRTHAYFAERAALPGADAFFPEISGELYALLDAELEPYPDALAALAELRARDIA